MLNFSLNLAFVKKKGQQNVCPERSLVFGESNCICYIGFFFKF